MTTDLLPSPNSRECLAHLAGKSAPELEALQRGVARAAERDAEVALARLAEYCVESDGNYQAILRILSCGSDESALAHAKRLLTWAVTQEADDLLAVIALLDEACRRASVAEQSPRSDGT